MNIAIASTDGINVNEHFGRASAFYIYEVHEKTFQLIMVNKLEQTYADETNPDHTFNEDKFMNIAGKLKLCQKIFVTKIGTTPANAFKEMGIDPVEYSGPISEIPIDP